MRTSVQIRWVLVSLLAFSPACSRSERSDQDTGVVQPDAFQESDLDPPDGTITFDQVTPPDSVIPGDQTPGDLEDDLDAVAPQGSTKALQQDPQGLNCAEGTAFINIASGLSLTGVIVTTPVFAASATLDAFFVQDAGGARYSGIKVTLNKGTAPALAVGDVLDLTGDLKEFYCMSQFSALTITRTGSGEVPSASTVQPANVASEDPGTEPWEAVLVKLENVDVVGVDQYGVVQLAGGAVVDDTIYEGFQRPKAGCRYASITGVVDYTFNLYRILPRFESDLVSDSSVECEGTTAEGTTIQEIQQSAESTVCSAEAFVNMPAVNLENLVVTSPRFVASKNSLHGFFVFDGEGGPFSGLMVVTPWADDVQLEIGDIIDIQGPWTEFYCMTQVKAEDKLEKTGTFDGELPVPGVTEADLIGADGEQYEGMLVRLSNVKVVETNQYGEARLEGGVWLDDRFPVTSFENGHEFESVTGLVYYSYSKWWVLPRSDADLN